MVYINMSNGERVVFNYDTRRWEYPDGSPYILGKKRSVCGKCGKPSLDLNGVCDCDFCLQSLTVCDFISDACCGHGDVDVAYISLKDGRRWVLDKEWSVKE